MYCAKLASLGSDELQNVSTLPCAMQRERLRAMQQKALAPKVPRVRNWNIVDDQEALALS